MSIPKRKQSERLLFWAFFVQDRLLMSTMNNPVFAIEKAKVSVRLPGDEGNSSDDNSEQVLFFKKRKYVGINFKPSSLLLHQNELSKDSTDGCLIRLVAVFGKIITKARSEFAVLMQELEFWEKTLPPHLCIDGRHSVEPSLDDLWDFAKRDFFAVFHKTCWILALRTMSVPFDTSEKPISPTSATFSTKASGLLWDLTRYRFNNAPLQGREIGCAKKIFDILERIFSYDPEFKYQMMFLDFCIFIALSVYCNLIEGNSSKEDFTYFQNSIILGLKALDKLSFYWASASKYSFEIKSRLFTIK